MKKLLFLFIFSTGLALLIVVTNFDFFMSIVPGWHTTIYPLWAIVAIILLAFIFIVSIVKILKLFFTKSETTQ